MTKRYELSERQKALIDRVPFSSLIRYFSERSNARIAIDFKVEWDEVGQFMAAALIYGVKQQKERKPILKGETNG